MFNTLKKVVGIAALAVAGAFFLIMPVSAETTNGSTDGVAGASSYNKGDAEGRGVATFSMNFSASAKTKGDFKSENEGDVRGMMFGTDADK